MSKGEIKAVDHHRNGISGNGFYVAIVEEEEGTRKLIITFDGDPSSTAVLDLDMAAAGNIFMHPEVDETGETVPGTGGNAWRGDHFASDYGARIEAAMDAKWDLLLGRIRKTVDSG